MAAKTIHCCLSVRGALRWSAKEMKDACKWISKPDGGRFTPDELRNEFMNLLADGNEVIPMGECDDFDPKTGCRGHEVRP